jgi:hypothetical protein
VLRRFTPELRFQIQLEHALYETADVMTENFAESFVDLRRLGLASQRVSELAPDHVECGFDVRPLVIVPHEPLLIVVRLMLARSTI